MADNPLPVAQSLDDYEAEEFRKQVMRGDWKEVIDKCTNNIYYHEIEIGGQGTALHVAINTEKIDTVQSLVKQIENIDHKRYLTILNDKGATPLHLAAYRGLEDMCELLIGKEGERKYLIKVENRHGETPLFWAVLGRKNLVFVYLQQFYPLDPNIAINNYGISILHIAIEMEMFDLATAIIHFNESLAFMSNGDGITPLEILATRKSAFPSENNLSWWKKLFYYCFPISRHGEITTKKLFPKEVVSEENAKKEEESYNQVDIPHCFNVAKLKKEYKINSQDSESKWRIMSLLEEIKIIKKKHVYGDLLLKEFMKNPIDSYQGVGGVPYGYKGYSDDEVQRIDGFFNSEIKRDLTEIMGGRDFKERILGKDTAYLTAARHGIFKMMEELQSKITSVFDETNSHNENALLLAVKNKQPHVIEWLKNDKRLFNHLTLQIDIDENTMLHLAANASSGTENTWWISGVAMQMMWDIKWYQYIQELVPDHFENRSNKKGETPSEIFKDTHAEILKESSDWMKGTAESCSVVAALIAGVSFATSGSVPGGNQQTGEPTLKGQPAFEGFAIFSLIGIYFSGTALIMFLSILTSRKEVEDFRRSLPMKLLFGLSSLFVSIAAMFVSFCAGHFFVLTYRYTKVGILFYLYISICLPVAFYGVVQLPLFVDLAKVLLKKVPPSSVKGVRL